MNSTTIIKTIEETAYIFASKAAEIPRNEDIIYQLEYLKNKFDNPTHVLFIGNKECYKLYYFKSEKEANRYLENKAFW